MPLTSAVNRMPTSISQPQLNLTKYAAVHAKCTACHAPAQCTRRVLPCDISHARHYHEHTKYTIPLRKGFCQPVLHADLPSRLLPAIFCKHFCQYSAISCRTQIPGHPAFCEISRKAKILQNSSANRVCMQNCFPNPCLPPPRKDRVRRRITQGSGRMNAAFALQIYPLGPFRRKTFFGAP